tara:strand:- start:138 stop:575 length:438 start_codon:yes stop_codon:yes gene_type:complete
MKIIYRIIDYIKKFINKISGVEDIEPLVKNIEQINVLENDTWSKKMDNPDDGLTGSSEDFIEALLETFMEYDGFKQTMTQPAYTISGSGHAWYYNPNTRAMSRIAAGTEVYLYKNKIDPKGRVYCYVGEEVLAIPKEDLLKIGYN